MFITRKRLSGTTIKVGQAATTKLRASSAGKSVRSTWLLGIPIAILTLYLLIGEAVISGKILAGIAGASSFLWLVFAVTAIYVLATGRTTWMRLSHGRVSGASVAGLAAGCYLIYGVALAMHR